MRVIDAAGNEIPWTQVQHISDAEMKDLMITIVNRIYTVLTKGHDPDIGNLLSLHGHSISTWNAPQIDENMLAVLRDYEAMVKDSDKAKAEIEWFPVTCRRALFDRAFGAR